MALPFVDRATSSLPVQFVTSSKWRSWLREQNASRRGWLACRVATHYVIDGLHEEDFEIWDSTGQLVAQSRQLAMLSERGPL